jgi:hypothetical protein
MMKRSRTLYLLTLVLHVLILAHNQVEGFTVLPSPSHNRVFALHESDDKNVVVDYDAEETLLKINLIPLVDTDLSFQKIQKYSRTFPFAAVLPVQPLQYLPTDDGGVQVLFLRKKTNLKSSVDGGIRFFIAVNKHKNKIQVTAKRNSVGQSIPKIIAERLVVTNYVAGLTEATSDVCGVSSIYHKWMDGDGDTERGVIQISTDNGGLQ